MFESHYELFVRYENDYESQQLEFPFTRHRKNSFVDLLSYEISTQNSDLDAIDIDSPVDLPIIHMHPQELEQVQLMLDDFPDFEIAQRLKPDFSPCRRVNESACNKVKSEKIGTLTIQERLKKIERYLEKKSKRTWIKKIHYNCRKKVADKRLRIKGRFVTANKIK